MVVSAIVISSIYGVYTFFMTSIASSSNVGCSQEQTYQNIGMVVSTIRRAESVHSLTSQSVTVLNGTDTLRITSNEDTLYRSVNSESPRSWVPLTNFDVNFPEDTCGWMMVTISGEYEGTRSTVHTVTQNVTLFLQEKSNGEDDWGF